MRSSIKCIINDTSFDPPKLNPHSFEYFIERLKEKIIPSVHDDQELLLNNSKALELMKQCWHEGFDIGYLYGYDDGYDEGRDE
jgi:hypothetical protein